MRKQILRRSFFVLTGIGAVIPGGALAQDRVPAATGSSESAAFQVDGLPVGGFRVYPTLRLSTDYDDNVSRSNDNKRGDGSFVIAPTVAARSNWSSHQLNLDAFYRDTHYFTRTDQNHDEYGASLSGRLDVMRTTAINVLAGYSRLAEQRGSPGDLFLSDNLVRYDTYNLSGQVSHQFNRIGINIGGGTANYQYDDVKSGDAIIDQSFRDRNVNTASGRVEYQYSAVTSLFISGSYNQTNYDHILNGLNRDSQGFTILTGVRFELSRLFSGEIGVGYIRQNFSSALYPDFSGVNYNISINYKPTALTSISLTGGRHLTDSALVQVAGVLESDLRLSVEHELLRNVLLQSFVGYSDYVYRGINRENDLLEVGLGVRYHMNKFVSLALSAEHDGQDSADIFGRKYVSNRGTFSLVFSR